MPSATISYSFLFIILKSEKYFHGGLNLRGEKYIRLSIESRRSHISSKHPVRTSICDSGHFSFTRLKSESNRRQSPSPPITIMRILFPSPLLTGLNIFSSLNTKM